MNKYMMSKVFEDLRRHGLPQERQSTKDVWMWFFQKVNEAGLKATITLRSNGGPDAVTVQVWNPVTWKESPQIVNGDVVDTVNQNTASIQGENIPMAVLDAVRKVFKHERV